MTREDAAAAEDFTVSDAIARYLTSQQTFGRLASATRKIHRSHLRRFAAAHGTTPFAAIDVDTIEGYLDQQMSAHVSRAAHKVLRALFRFGTKKMRWRADDPTKQIDAPKVKAGAGREPWSDGELRQFEAAHPIGTKARLCFALALYTGQRRGDLRKIRHGDFGDDGTLSVRQQKTGAELYLPVRPELRAIIDASPCGADFLLVTKTGRQFGANDLSDQFHKWCSAAGVTKTLHGLRATMLTKGADDGWTPHELAAWSGHKTLSEVQRYTKKANQRRLAQTAMAKSIPRTRDSFDGASSIRNAILARFDVSPPISPPAQGFLSGSFAKHTIIAGLRKSSLEASREVRRV